MSTVAPDYGGDEMASADRLGEIISALSAHEDRLSGHSTLEVRAYDDGDIHAELTHTVSMVAGAAGVPPATLKQAIVYQRDESAIEYQEFALRAGEKDIQTREVLAEVDDE